MAQFDVFANPSSSASQAVPFVINLQSDLLIEIRAVVVAPLVSAGGLRRDQRLYPILEVAGQPVALVVTELATLPRSALRRPVANLAAERSRIIAALDLLFTGV